jgi:hypothetical protein
MRRLARITPALLGLALAAPVAAQSPTPGCQPCETGYVVPPTQMPSGFRAPRLCGECFKKYKETGQWPGPVPPNPYAPPTYPAGNGYAMSGSFSPGYAVAGGTVVPDAPMPIGVMQAGYRPHAGMPMAATPPSMTPGMAVSGGLPPYAPMPYEPAPFAGPHSSPRPSILRSMLGLNWRSRWAADRAARRNADHAREAYGVQPGAVSELPSSVVYGR